MPDLHKICFVLRNVSSIVWFHFVRCFLTDSASWKFGIVCEAVLISAMSRSIFHHGMFVDIFPLSGVWWHDEQLTITDEAHYLLTFQPTQPTTYGWWICPTANFPSMPRFIVMLVHFSIITLSQELTLFILEQEIFFGRISNPNPLKKGSQQKFL